MRRLVLALAMLALASPISHAQVNMTAEEIKQRQEELSRTTGHIVGTVTDEVTGVPLEGVLVSANYMGDDTDDHGHFNVPYQKPGTAEVTAYRRDYISSSLSVVIVAGKATTLNVRLKRQQKPCCVLEGLWRATVTYGTGDSQREVSGTILFDRRTPDPMPHRKKIADDTTADEFGRYDIDLEALLGRNYTDRTPTTIFGGDVETMLVEAAGYVSNIDHVTINLIPRMSHGGLTLEGRVDGNVIKGRWYLREYGVSKVGGFSMERAIKVRNGE